jgi:prophage maintenance system killer protein
MYALLAINGLALDADETETAGTIEAVAAGDLTEAALTKWIAAQVR